VDKSYEANQFFKRKGLTEDRVECRRKKDVDRVKNRHVEKMGGWLGLGKRGNKKHSTWGRSLESKNQVDQPEVRRGPRILVTTHTVRVYRGLGVQNQQTGQGAQVLLTAPIFLVGDKQAKKLGQSGRGKMSNSWRVSMA